MSIVAPGFGPVALTAVGDWHPTRYTPTLTGSEEFRTDADRLLPMVARHWRTPEGPLTLDPWQAWLIRHLLERYPEDWPVVALRGRLRYRQVLISMGRQNGKSVIGALIVLYLLTLHRAGPRVAGFASRDRQARIIYDRVKEAVQGSPALAAELRATDTRGISGRYRPGIYQTFPANEDAVQGEPFSGTVYDELHLGLAGLWDAIVLGMKAQPHALLVGLTTAGDTDSHLLIRLMGEADAAIAGQDERFGAFIWEAPADELTEPNVIAANPAVACGRVPLDQTMHDARKMWTAPADKDGVLGRDRVIRYTLNRMLSHAASAWASATAWAAGTAPEVDHGPRAVYGIDRTPDQEWAALTLTTRVGGELRTQLVASVPEATNERLLAVCEAAATVTPGVFALDRSHLKALGDSLRERGYTVHSLIAGEMVSATETTAAAIARYRIKHPGDDLVRVQMSRGKRRQLPEGSRLSASLSTGDVDAVFATIVGCYVAEADADPGMQLG